MDNELLLPHQVALEAGISPAGVRAAESRGEIQATRAGNVRLFRRKDVNVWLKRRRDRQQALEPETSSVAR